MQQPTHRARRILDAVSRAYPMAREAFERMARQRGRSTDFDWPEWCYMPIAAGLALVDERARRQHGRRLDATMGLIDHPAIVVALETWRRTQGIYQFDPTLFNQLINTPWDGDIPTTAEAWKSTTPPAEAKSERCVARHRVRAMPRREVGDGCRPRRRSP